MAVSQLELDAKNARFWNELCGTSLARSLGITTASVDTLRRFDSAFLTRYPYLEGYVDSKSLIGRKVLEIGMGYGTLSQILAKTGCKYYGVDIAKAPVGIVRYRLASLGLPDESEVQVASALNLPYRNSSFDYVYTIGCLHHTGNLSEAVNEIYRVLKPGAQTIVMLYNRLSFRRQVQVPVLRIARRLLHRCATVEWSEQIRSLYDTNSKGEAAPHTDYVSPLEVRSLFRNFQSLRIEQQNFDEYTLTRHRLGLRREWALKTLAAFAGLDLYIVATK